VTDQAIPHVSVAIVGAGPTGITAATLLAQYGVDCLVLDRWPGVYPQPRAVHLDDEIYRVIARLGIGDEFAAVSRPALGLRPTGRSRVRTRRGRIVRVGRQRPAYAVKGSARRP